MAIISMKIRMIPGLFSLGEHRVVIHNPTNNQLQIVASYTTREEAIDCVKETIRNNPELKDSVLILELKPMTENKGLTE